MPLGSGFDGGFQLIGLQALPKDAQPISLWSDQDDAFTDVAKGLLARIQQLQQELKSNSSRSNTASTTTVHDVLEADFFAPSEPVPLKADPAQASRSDTADEDILKSEKGIDYSKLRDLLKAGEWGAADSETKRCMLKAVHRQSGDWIRDSELLNFRGTDLLTIDQLWVKYSHGQFGFSVQKQIYVECGAKLDGQYPGDENWGRFMDRVGWENGRSAIFSTSTPYGHLPTCTWWVPHGSRRILGIGFWGFWGVSGWNWCSLLSHRDL